MLGNKGNARNDLAAASNMQATLRTLLKTGTKFSVFSEKHQKR